MNYRKAAFALVPALALASTVAAAGPAPSAVPAPASEPITYTPPSWPEPPTAGPLLLRLVLATGAVLAIGIATSFAVRRFAPRPPAGRNDSRLQLLETLSLGNGTSLYLLECCGRRFVAGVSPSGFRSLAPLPEPFENELDVLASLT
jgi:flagellar biogenesis protein FliO